MIAMLRRCNKFELKFFFRLLLLLLLLLCEMQKRKHEDEKNKIAKKQNNLNLEQDENTLQMGRTEGRNVCIYEN